MHKAEADERNEAGNIFQAEKNESLAVDTSSSRPLIQWE
jgi:hypothetical protein